MLFLILSATPPLILVYLIMRKILPSRMDINSKSFRSALIYLVVYIFIYSLWIITYSVLAYEHDSEAPIDSARDSEAIAILTLSLIGYLWNFLFPIFLLPTLRADSQFWRGVSANSGIETEDRENLMPVEMSIASQDIQEMLSRIGGVIIDFAFLRRGAIIGRGSTARVYRGVYRKRKVAIKVSTPPEISDTLLEALESETRTMRSLDYHPNIIGFLGIIVKPPQVGLVLQLCVRGDLKTHLQKSREYWTPPQRLRACLECCMSVAFLHENNILHRDIKCNNFFLNSRYKIKLGDFGESFMKPENEDFHDMAILGTVSYMAPELIAADKSYGFPVDVYALGITMWEIWTGSEAFGDIGETFAIYKMVQEGQRPKLPTNAPEKFVEVLQDAWKQKSSDRPSATQLVHRLCPVLMDMASDAGVIHEKEFSHTIAIVENNNRALPTDIPRYYSKSSFKPSINLFGKGYEQDFSRELSERDSSSESSTIKNPMQISRR